MRHSILHIISSVLVLIVMSLSLGCGHSARNERLTEVAEQISDTAQYAKELLERIDRESLSTPDRHFYDFLSLKINDKNYVLHTSDSLYLSIKDYYSHHKNNDLYPEVLYYGGRVYSDLGDYPTALKYFQDALDALPDNTDNLDLKSRILSQTGRLLNQLRLYTEAEGYIEKVVQINRKVNKPELLMYNLQLLGSINMNLQNFTLAKKHYKEAYEISKTISPVQEARAKMYLAEVEKQLGNIHAASLLISGVPEAVKPIVQDQANAYACDIYYTAGKLDSAYLYCRKLIDKPSASNRKTAFNIILSPEMLHFIPNDSLSWYVAEYLQCITEYVRKSDSSQAEMQVSAFNYSSKQREIEKLEEKHNKMMVWLLSGIILLLLFSFLLVTMLSRGKIRNLKHQIALEKIRNLQEKLKNVSVSTNIDKISSMTLSDKKVQDLKREEDRLLLREKIREAASSVNEVAVPSQILESDVYGVLQKYIKNEKIIPPHSKIWKDLDALIAVVSPDFKKTLTTLMNGKETQNDIETCLLIKCGIGPTGMSILLGKSPGAIVSRRDNISQKIFDEKIGTKLTDIVIRLL